MSVTSIASVSSVSQSRPQAPRRWRMQLGPLTIDPYLREVRVDGELIELTKMEYALLCHLATEPARVFPKATLMQHVWGIQPSENVRTRTLDSHASRLRVKLSAGGRYKFVTNVWSVGYRLIDSAPDVEPVNVCPLCGGLVPDEEVE